MKKKVWIGSLEGLYDKDITTRWMTTDHRADRLQSDLCKNNIKYKMCPVWEGNQYNGYLTLGRYIIINHEGGGCCGFFYDYNDDVKVKDHFNWFGIFEIDDNFINFIYRTSEAVFMKSRHPECDENQIVYSILNQISYGRIYEVDEGRELSITIEKYNGLQQPSVGQYGKVIFAKEIELEAFDLTHDLEEDREEEERDGEQYEYEGGDPGDWLGLHQIGYS